MSSEKQSDSSLSCHHVSVEGALVQDISTSVSKITWLFYLMKICSYL